MIPRININNLIAARDGIEDQGQQCKKERYVRKRSFMLSIREIANELRVSETTVTNALTSALKKLKTDKNWVIFTEMCYNRHRDNFTNPNQGGEAWQFIRSLLQR